MHRQASEGIVAVDQAVDRVTKGGPTRRALLACTSAGAAVALRTVPGRARTAAPHARTTPRAEPVPMRDVRLDRSPFLDALRANRIYLFSLDPDRLLHNYRVQAGLPPRKPAYAGWEAETISGHTLGHYLSALSLLHAQTGDADACRRVASIVRELALCQAQSPDGYVGGLTRVRDGVTEGGRAVFDEVRRGEIRARPFDLNGAWSPLYNWHKLLAGLLDADRHCDDRRALRVAVRLADYLDGVFAPLDDDDTERVLLCEYGGLNESLAELHVRTGAPRFLVLAERIADRRTLDPLRRGEDDLGGLHANTQIPKIIGLARLFEITGRSDDAQATATFWTAATERHGYVIGGVGDQEYFTAPDSTADYLTEQTCESCASYNMLKLARHLYGRDPKAAIFDRYERTQLNHILAQHDPRTGMFTYMMPVISGGRREWSTPTGDFWCCVGTGMESHAKHGDSIWWHAGSDALAVNLFIPSMLRWRGIALRLETDYPAEGLVTIGVVETRRRFPWTLRLRLPAWSRDTALSLNGEALAAVPDADGYLTLRRHWRRGDTVALRLDMRLRTESPRGATGIVSFLRGPVVLAADLGPADQPFSGGSPSLVAERSDDLIGSVTPIERGAGRFRLSGSRRPGGGSGDLVLGPFAAARDRRSAIYFPVCTEREWLAEQARTKADDDARHALIASAVDVFAPGDLASERDHDFVGANSNALTYRFRRGRDARDGGSLAFRMRRRPGPLKLRLVYWGEDRNRAFRILADDAPVATVALDGTGGRRFIEVAYGVPPAAGSDAASVLIRIQPLSGRTAGPIFEAMTLAAGITAPGTDARSFLPDDR